VTSTGDARLDIAVVDPQDEPALRAWYDALRAGACADRTAALISSYRAMAAMLRGPVHTWQRTAVAAVRAGATVGAMLVDVPVRENLTTASVEVAVPPEHRRQGVARALWGVAVEMLAGEDRTVVQTEVHVPAGHTPQTWPGALFAERLGARVENVEDHFVLPLPAAAPARRPAGDEHQVVSWEGRCPERFIEAYASMRTAMTGDVPTGGLLREASVWDADRVRTSESRLIEQYVVLVSMALTAHGEPAGYTLAFLDRGDPDNALQDDTFVRPEHRGHGLGMRLKLANLPQVEAHRGDRRWLHTWTATDNTPMQRVNVAFGFRLVERTHEYEWVRGR